MSLLVQSPGLVAVSSQRIQVRVLPSSLNETMTREDTSPS